MGKFEAISYESKIPILLLEERVDLMCCGKNHCLIYTSKNNKIKIK